MCLCVKLCFGGTIILHFSPPPQLAGIYQAYDGKCHLKPYSSSSVNYIPSVVGEQIYNEDSLLYVREHNRSVCCFVCKLYLPYDYMQRLSI